MDPLENILADARDRLIAHLASNDEFIHRLREVGDDSLRPNEFVRTDVERVLHGIEGLLRRLRASADDDTGAVEATSDVLPHGGVVSISGPFGDDDGSKARAGAADFEKSIASGMATLERGGSRFAPDMEPMPNAAVEVFDVFDIATGQHHMIWRVACRQRRPQALMSDDRSQLDAELQYQKQRTAELAEEFKARISDLGAVVGANIAPDAVTPDAVEALARFTIEFLRRHGNPALAEQYDAAVSEMRRHDARRAALLDSLRAQPTFTADDRAQLDAARAASDEALEQYERVQAQVDAWLESQERSE